MSDKQSNLFESSDSTTESAIAVWSFVANSNCISRVVPDGCSDIIISEGGAGLCRQPGLSLN